MTEPLSLRRRNTRLWCRQGQPSLAGRRKRRLLRSEKLWERFSL